MSIFQKLNVPCPNCATPIAFDAVHSVNADRRPDLRQAILSGQFQRKECPACGTGFRLDPVFVFNDQRRGQWIASNGVAALADWAEHERAARELFETSYGASAPAVVQAMGRSLKPRLVFGWSALREKIVSAEAGLDDIALELTKLVVLRSAQGAPFEAAVSVRLMSAQPQRLLFGWVRNDDDAVGDLRWIGREAYDEVLAEAQRGAEGDWAEALETFEGACFIDVDRLLVLQDGR
jgi:hypothetical protein